MSYTITRIGARVERPLYFACIAAITTAAALLHWWSAPSQGDFWWPDSSRHLMNGVFVRDALLAFPVTQPMQWAQAYYDQYPALTIGFYPPGFAAALAGLFLLTGASHAAAQVFMTASLVLLALAAAFVVRAVSGTLPALITAGLTLTVPELLLWSRQIQPEVPALAVVCTALALAVAKPFRGQALVATAAFVAALYFKQTMIVLAPLLAWALVRNGFPRISSSVALAGFAGLLAVPLVVLQLMLGGENLRSVQSFTGAAHGRWELGNWLWYARAMPELAGWPLLAAAATAPLAFVAAARPNERRFAWVLAATVALVYVLFSYVSLKETRHLVPMLLPLVMLAGVGLGRVCRLKIGWLAPICLLAVAAFAAREQLVPRIAGPDRAAQWVAANAGGNCTVLLHAAQDGNFIANLRLVDRERRCTVVRSDKLLFDVRIRRESGISERSLTPEQLGSLLRELAVSHVVVDRSFWDDLANSRLLAQVATSEPFVRRAQFAVDIQEPKGAPRERARLEVYENTAPPAQQARRLSVQPSVGRP